MKRSIIATIFLVAVTPGLAFATPAVGSPIVASSPFDSNREFAVTSGLQSMLRQPMVREQLGRTLELASTDDLDRLAIGPGVRVHTVDAAAVRQAADLVAATRVTDSWRYILSVDDTVVGLATIERSGDGSYRLVDIGARSLATSLAAAVVRQPAGSHPFLLRSIDTHIDMLAADSAASGQLRYTRLEPLAGGDTLMADRAALDGEELALLFRDALVHTR